MLQAVGPKETKACPFFRKFFFCNLIMSGAYMNEIFPGHKYHLVFYVCVYAHQLIRNHSGCKELYTFIFDVIITGTVIFSSEHSVEKLYFTIVNLLYGGECFTGN